ncbi:ATP-binding cassette domain-containing protein [Streptomyces hypolithicus]
MTAETGLPRSRPSDVRGALRRVAPDGRRFLRAHPKVLLRLGGWSVLESVQTFLGGYCVARALDQGFLTGRTGVGLAWLAVAAVAVLAGGVAVRGVFGGLAGLAEPLRDGLVRRAVDRALATAVADPARADSKVVSRLTHQTEIARDSFAGLVLTARSFVFTAAGALFGMASLAPQLLLVVVPPLLIGLLMFLATLLPMAVRQRDYLESDEALADRVGAAADGLRDITACGAQQHTARAAAQLIGTQARVAGSLARWAAVRTLALGTAGSLPVVVLLAATPWLLRQGVTTGALVGALTYLVQALLPALHTLMTALGAAGTRLLIVLDRFGPAPPPKQALPAQADHGPPASVGADARPLAVELRALTFAYAPGAHPVVDGLDLTVSQGEHLAVVGPSGIGKSTLTALVAGLLRPDGGTVHLNGHPATDARALRSRVLIPQQAYVFTGTVRDNLRYLHPQASAEALDRAVDAVGCRGLVQSLGGLDAPLDPRRLSQGERQLLALARAYVSPAPLVVLDEATCHLDPAAEARAERAMAGRQGGTLVVVAHRISSAYRADRVLVLDGTRAVCGPHEAMLGRSALYRELVGQWETDPV